MVTCFILFCFSLLLFIIYNIVSIILFGVPWSLSKTYYLYEEKKKGLGWIFTIFMWILAFTMLPGFLSISDAIGPWMSYFTFLAFITCASIAFVGTAPKYHEDLEGDVHMTVAKICAASAILWDFLVCWNVWWISICSAVIPIILGFITKSWKDSRDYWIEMIAFFTTFGAVIGEFIIQLNK